jgi:hypothetical protein
MALKTYHHVEDFYVTQSGQDMPEKWLCRIRPLAARKVSRSCSAISELYPSCSDGSFAASVVQEDSKKSVLSFAVAWFHLDRDGKAFVLQNWAVPLQ